MATKKTSKKKKTSAKKKQQTLNVLLAIIVVAIVIVGAAIYFLNGGGIYQVTFYNYDNTVIDSNYYPTNGDLIVPDDPVREGYVFSGWDKELELKVTHNETYTATYQEGKYTVVFKDYDGTVISTAEYSKNELVNVPNDPTRDGYTFTGWDKELELNAKSNITYTATYKKDGGGDVDTISFHFIDLQEKYAGDSIYIKAGDTDIIIDGGARQRTAAVIEAYVDQYCTDGIIEYAIATHGDQDHIAAFVGTSTVQGLFDYYTIETFIDNDLSNKTTTLYKNYCSKRDSKVQSGMKYYTAYDCTQNANGASKVYEIGEGLTMEVLYQYFYDHTGSDENNYSVCLLFTDTINNKYFLLTGDLEKEGEESLLEYNTLPEVELFKAGHHGSPTSSGADLLAAIKPKIVTICCTAGSDEYTSNIDNIFPSTAAIDRIKTYTDKVYCTSQIENDAYAPLNGTIVVTSVNGVVSVNCTNNNTLLKDSGWFNSNIDYYMDGTKYMLLDSKHKTADGTRTWRTW